MPIWLTLILPAILIWNSFVFIYKKLVPSITTTTTCTTTTTNGGLYNASNKIDRNQRQYDLILYGATGFTGKMAARYIAKNYKDSGLKWALAGRKKDVLEKLKDDLQCNNVGIVIADSSKL